MFSRIAHKHKDKAVILRCLSIWIQARHSQLTTAIRPLCTTSYHTSCNLSMQGRVSITRYTDNYHGDDYKTGTKQIGPHILLGGILGLFGFRDEDKDEEGKVPFSVKRQLFNAQKAQLNGEYNRAEDCYHEALRILGTGEGAHSQVYTEARAVTLDKLANFYLEQGKYTEAEAALKETLRLILTVTGDLDGTITKEKEAIIEISLKLAMIYANQGRYDEADVGFGWCVEMARECVKESSTDNQQSLEESITDNHLALLGVCLDAQGKFFTITGRHTEAVSVYKEAKEIAIELYAEKSLQYATLLTHEATAVLNLKQPNSSKEAEQLLRDSLAIMESLSGPEAVQVMAVACYNLAMVLDMRDCTDERVEQQLRKSVALLESLKDVAMLGDLELYLYKLGTTLIKRGKVEEAKTVLTRAEEIARDTNNNDLLTHIAKALHSS